jgi:hypothetical protein
MVKQTILNEQHKIVRALLIEEKYKATTLESHSQAKKRKENKKTTHPVGLGHQHGHHSTAGRTGTSTQPP